MQTLRDLLLYRDLLLALTEKELKAQYRNMALGFFWALLQPLVMVAVLSWVFIVFFEGKADQPGQVVVGLIPYNFFSYCVTGCVGSVVGNAALVKKVYFPRQILPASAILTSLVHFGVQSLLVVAILVILPTKLDPLSWNLLWLVPIVVLQIGLCAGVGMLVAALNVAFRDTRYVVESGMIVLFYLSPTMYDARARFEETGGRMSTLEWAYFLNPLAGILDGYRSILLHAAPPHPTITACAVVVTLLLGVVGVRAFWILERQFADMIQ